MSPNDRNYFSGVEIWINEPGPFFSTTDRITPPPSKEDQARAENDRLRVEAESLRDRLSAYEEALRQINNQPCSYTTVIGQGSDPRKWLVKKGAETLEVSVGSPNLNVRVGSMVRVLTSTMNIVGVVEDAPPTGGELVKVISVLNDSACEVSIGAGSRSVLTGKYKVKPGDRVVLDMTNTVVVGSFGQEKPAQVFSLATGVTWDSIGGQTEAKAAMREAVEGPVKNKAIYARYGRRPTKGVLLYGPPGNGKTMLGKAAASALAELHGGSATSSGFLYIKGPELLSMYVGASEQGVRALFDSARRHKAEHGYPAVIFIDEAEALLGKRGSFGISGALSSTLVPMFLAEMDGMEDSGALVVLATNRPESLDPAIVREGRIDRKVLVGRPSSEDAVAVFERHLQGRPLAEGFDVNAAVSALYDTKHVLYKVTRSDGPPKTVTLGHLTSGAQIAALVDVAASFAIERELGGSESVGITTQDAEKAVERTLKEQRCVDHTDELAIFCEPFYATVTNIERSDGKRPSLKVVEGGPQVLTVAAGGSC